MNLSKTLMQKLYYIISVSAIIFCVLTMAVITQKTAGNAEEKMGKLQEQKLSEFKQDERKQLLQLARKALNYYFEKEKPLKILGSEIPGKFLDKRGCFVTLTKGKDHALRGCIGNIQPHKTLYEAVADNALNAAIQDWRFSPVTKNELKDIQIEISVLTIPKKLEFSSPDDLLAKIRPGIDGVYLFYGNKNSTYLPQVWEKLSDK